MGCGSSKSATDTVQQPSVAAPGTQAGLAAEPLAENVATVHPPVLTEQVQPAPSKPKEKAPVSTVTAKIQDTHDPDLSSSLNDNAERPAVLATANQKAKAVEEPPAPVSKGVVMDRVGAILNQDDDDFESEDVVAAASKLLDEPASIPADKGTFRMQGSSKPAQKIRNPISDNLGDIDTPADTPMAASSQKDPVSNYPQIGKSQQNFTDLSDGGSALPSVRNGSNAGNGAWSMHSDLDALMDAPAAPKTQKQHRGPDKFEQVLLFTEDDVPDEEEEDAFNAMAIPAPKFVPPPSEPKFEPSKARPGRGGAPAERNIFALDEEPEAPADPWDMLQNQYRIRDSESAEGRRPGGGFNKGQLDPEEELVLDEYTGNAPVRKKKPETKRRPVVPDLPPKKGAAIAANWGDGEMAQAGDLMLGRGALDFDDDAGFSGYGDVSAFSAASYVEYRGNEGSMDMEVLEVPRLDKFGSTGLDMEDFNEEMENFGIIKPKGKPTLDDKLRMFEGMNDDLDDDDLLLHEELRLASNQDY